MQCHRAKCSFLDRTKTNCAELIAEKEYLRFINAAVVYISSNQKFRFNRNVPDANLTREL